MDVARLSIVVALGFGLIGCDGEVSACEGATPYLFNGEDRGFVQCEGGLIHRELAKECQVVEGFRSSEPVFGCGLTEYAECGSDGDCGLRARCVNPGPSGRGCYCEYMCVTDADCSPTQICACPTSGGRCVSAECKTSADCPEGSLCISTVSTRLIHSYACTRENDSCRIDADCPMNATSECLQGADGRRTCECGTCDY